jgi:hypothetical protein
MLLFLVTLSGADTEKQLSIRTPPSRKLHKPSQPINRIESNEPAKVGQHLEHKLVVWQSTIQSGDFISTDLSTDP